MKYKHGHQTTTTESYLDTVIPKIAHLIFQNYGINSMKSLRAVFPSSQPEKEYSFSVTLDFMLCGSHCVPFSSCCTQTQVFCGIRGTCVKRNTFVPIGVEHRNLSKVLWRYKPTVRFLFSIGMFRSKTSWPRAQETGLELFHVCVTTASHSGTAEIST